MPDLSDETLMAFADGELTPAERARVEGVLAGNPQARVRLAGFVATGRKLAVHFDKPMREPVPRHLIDAILGEREAASQQRVAPPLAHQDAYRAAGLAERLARAFGLQLTWRTLALASSAALLLGSSAGWVAHWQSTHPGDGGQGMLAIENGHMQAIGPLARLLETAPSGTRVAHGADAGPRLHLRAQLTFRSRSGFCRQYEISAPSGGGGTGIGCRDAEGRWHLQVHTAAPTGAASSATPRPAGGGEALPLQSFIERNIDGDVLGAGEEAAAIAAGWRLQQRQ